MAPMQDLSQSTEVATTKPKQASIDKEELSEEDQKLKDDLEALVERLKEPGQSAVVYNKALDSMKTFIKDSTSSMTAVPKPLKFLRPFYGDLTGLYETWSKAEFSSTLISHLTDILSVLGMTSSEEDVADTLKYRLISGSDTIADWGHEYMRHLALEIGESYQESLGSNESYTTSLIELSLKIVPYLLKNNAEADAVDLLTEVESIEKLPQFLDDSTYARVCLYMVSCVPLLAPPDDLSFLNTAFSIYLAHNQLTQALILAINLDSEALINQVFESTDDYVVHKQLGLILASQFNRYTYPGDKEGIQETISNVKLPEYFAYLSKELNLLDPKVPEDIYKSHLEDSKSSYGSGSIDSAKQNLAASFVNAFTNAGFCNDKLILQAGKDETKSWIYKTKGSGKISSTASIGSIYQWNIDDGLQALDKYTYSNEDDIKAGSLLGIGIVSANIHDDAEAALALLQEYVTYPKKAMQSSAIMGLGIAFAGSGNQEVMNLLSPLIGDTNMPMEVSCLASLALGLVFVGTCNSDITSTILQTFLERDVSQLNNKYIRFLALGVGFLYMGKTEKIDDVLDIIDAIEHPINKTLKVLVNICAYAGTGNVLQIQSLLQMCSAKPKDNSADIKVSEDEEEQNSDVIMSEVKDAESSNEKTREDDSSEVKEEEEEVEEEEEEEERDEEGELYQGFAVMGLACIAMGEDIGLDMVIRHFSHLMHYGNPMIRRAVPLAMGLVSVSNPQMKVFDTLSRFSHDPDMEVSQNAIYAMGLVGAGTNNARLAQLLRQLAQYYSKSPDCLFMVRIAQGLLYLGKGTHTLTPFNSERSIMNKVSLASLMTISVALLDPKDFILNDTMSETTHQLLYFLTPAIKPRMLVTVDEEMNPIKVNVRVGQAVDVVGQAGKPKTITGWVTQATPVLLNHGERAELENPEEWISLSHSLDGVVILKKNPEYMEVDT